MLLWMRPACRSSSCPALPVCFLPISLVPSSIPERTWDASSPTRLPRTLLDLSLVVCVWVSLGCTPASWAGRAQGWTDLSFPKDWVTALGTATALPAGAVLESPPAAGITPLANFCYPIRTNVTSHLLAWIHISLMTGWLSTSLLGLVAFWISFFFF